MTLPTAVSSWRARLLVCGCGLALFGSSLGTVAAAADPVGDKQAQASALAQQIDSLGRKEAALSEQYDKSALDVQTAQDNIARSAGRAALADADAAQARSLLRVDSVDAYIHGGSMASRAGGSVGAQAAIMRAEYAQTLASTQAEHLDRFRTAAAQAKSAADALEASRQQAARSVSRLDAARGATVASERQLQATLAQVKGDIATLVAQIEAAKLATQTQQAQQLAARRQASATAASPAGVPAAAPAGVAAAAPTGTTDTTPRPAPAVPTAGPSTAAPPAAATRPTIVPPPAPVGSGGGAAVAAAMTRLGLPYVWGAAGPDSFDCSGLTRWAWAHAGVSLPHFSGAQYASTTHIPMSSLQPGDLVFGADTSAHVAMYIGGGQIIAAPHTGTVVQIQALSGNYVLASRP